MKILLGVDTSPHASETLSMVCRMPWPKGTSVHVISVVGTSEPQYAPQPHVIAAVAGNLAVLEAQELAIHEDLIARAAVAMRLAGLEAAGTIAYGDPRHVLVDTARAEGIELVVVGSHPHPGFSRLTAGSVAAHLVAHAPCNVLVVRHDLAEPWR